MSIKKVVKRGYKIFEKGRMYLSGDVMEIEESELSRFASRLDNYDEEVLEKKRVASLDPFEQAFDKMLKEKGKSKKQKAGQDRMVNEDVEERVD